MNFAQTLVPDDAELRFFLLQFAELGKHGAHLRAGRKPDAVGHHGGEQSGLPLGLCAETIAGQQRGKPRHRADCTSFDSFRLCIVRAGVQPYLRDLFFNPFAAPWGIGNGHPHPETAARDLQKGQTVALGVAGDLIDPRGKFVGIVGRFCEALQNREQFVHAVQVQRRAEKTGEKFFRRPQGGDCLIGQSAVCQIGVQSPLVTQGDALLIVPGCAEFAETRLHVLQQALLVRTRQVHLVEKQQGRDVVAAQELPESLGVGLYAVGAADDQNRIVRHGHGPLGLGGEIYVARGVDQGDRETLRLKPRLLGEDRDAPRPL